MKHNGTWVIRGVVKGKDARGKSGCGADKKGIYEDVNESQQLIQWLLSEPNSINRYTRINIFDF